MKQSVSQLMAQDKRGGVVFRGCQDIVDAAFYLIVGAAEIFPAVRQHNELIDVLINVIILSVFIGLRHGRVGNVRIMDLFKEGRAYDALENVVSPASVVDGDAVFIRLKKRAAAIKAVFRRRAERVDIEAVRHAAVRLRVQRFPPQPLNIFDEIRLLAFGVALGTEQDHHVLRVAAGLLDHIHRNGGVGVLTVGRVALAHLHLKIRLGVHIPVPVAGVPLGGRKRGAVRGLARRGANIGISRRAAAGGHGIIRRVQIERRTDAVVALAGRVASDAPLRAYIAHIVVAVRHRRPQPVAPVDAVPVLPDVVAAEVFIDGMELLDVQQEHLVGDVLVMRALIAVRHRADVGVVGEVGPRRVDVARGVLRVGNDGALRHRFDGGGLVRRKAVEEARLAVIRAAAQNVLVLGRVAAEPFHLSGPGVGIEPRAHIAVPPVVGAVFAPVAAAPVGAAVGILAGLRVIGHRVAQYPVREHQGAIFVYTDAAPQNRLAVVAAQLNVIAELNARLRARGPDRQREQAQHQDSGKEQSRHSAAFPVLHVLSPFYDDFAFGGFILQETTEKRKKKSPIPRSFPRPPDGERHRPLEPLCAQSQSGTKISVRRYAAVVCGVRAGSGGLSPAAVSVGHWGKKKLFVIIA